MKRLFLPAAPLSLALLVAAPACTTRVDSPVDHVDPFIGTGEEGHTFPGAARPFGMVQLSPDTGYRGVKAYNHSQTSILGFSHTHLSGTGPGTKTHYNNILIVPTVGELEVQPGIVKELNALSEEALAQRLADMPVEEAWHTLPPREREAKRESLLREERRRVLTGLARRGFESEPALKGYESRFDHATEEASPGYYAVTLEDYGVRAELTATERVGFHRYTFPKTREAHILVDATHSLTPGRGTQVRVVDRRQIEGYTVGDREGFHEFPLTCYFVAEFSRDFDSFGTWKGSEVHDGTREMSGDDGVGAFATFSTSEGEQVLVKVGLSFVSLEGARRNLEAEVPHWDFDRVRREARETWDGELRRIRVKGATDEQKTIFYTALYHSLLFPRVFSDVDGSYYSHFDDAVHGQPGERYYVDFSLWDTYRAQHPLLVYLEPERQTEMIRSLLAMYDQGDRLPLHVTYKNYYMAVMIGDHATSVIVDSYMKGLRDFDAEKAYAAMRKNATVPGERASSRYGLEYYESQGYLPADRERESVSVTLEAAYDDACLAKMARALGREDDHERFSRRARNYENLYDPTVGLMRPRNLDGSWLQECGDEPPEILHFEDHSYYSCFDPLWVGRSPNRHFTESNAWQYLWHVPHDVQGLIELMGGRSQFTEKLDTLFTMTPHDHGPRYAPLSSKIGQYVHGNEPVHHVAYLYDYAGEPWKTQQRVSQIREEMYGVGPDGLCGNDDMGQMSAWYLFSAMGFYPVCPGQNVLAIGTPLFNEITMRLGDLHGGREFTVRAPGVSSENVYIQSATLNGEPYDKPWIIHDAIVAGGTLTLEMGPQPNRTWGSAPEAAPPSMTP